MEFYGLIFFFLKISISFMVSFKIVLMGAHGFSFCLFFMFQCQKAVAVVSSFLEASSLRENIFLQK